MKNEKMLIMKVRLNKNLYGGQKLVGIPKDSGIELGDYVQIIKIDKSRLETSSK